MTTATEDFFEQLGLVRGDPRLRSCSGTLRFDIKRREHTEHWLVRIERGDAGTERHAGDAADADCAVAGEGDLFDEIVLGRQNGTAALLRGAFAVDGDVGLLLWFQRFFPGPPDQRGPSRQGTREQAGTREPAKTRRPASTAGGR
jgi:hypothetical protein